MPVSSTRPASTPQERAAAVGDAVTEHATPICFGAAGRLFGWYHPARGVARGTARVDCAVVLCPPLGYEELCAHRSLRHWAEALAAAGVATLRFDYDGTGNSAGNDMDRERVAEWIASIEQAATELRARSGVTTLALAGVRLGGTLALAAAERVNADSLVLFAAPATGRAYVRELRAWARLGATEGDERFAREPNVDGVEQVAGFALTAATATALRELDPLARPLGVRRAFVVPRDDVAADATLPDRLTAAGVAVDRAMVPGYAKMMVDAHESLVPWHVIAESVSWLTSHYPPAPAADGDVRERHAARADMSRSTAARAAGRSDPLHESPVIFDASHRLFGMLSEPAVARSDARTGIVIANAGSVHNVGPGRLYVDLARHWSSLGFSVLRIDLGGVGDSDTPVDGTDSHPYPDHAVRDIGLATRWLREKAGVERVLVAGLCSGAHASFHAGLRLDDIDGIIVVNPIVFYWNPACALDVSAWMSYYESRRYARSARQLDAWMRLARGRVNVRHAVVVAFRRLLDVAGGTAVAMGRWLGLRPRNGEDVAADLARICARGVDVLLVFSEGDPGLDFLQRRHAREIRRLESRLTNFAMRVIPGADHTFTRIEARERLRTMLATHLVNGRYLSGPRSPTTH